MPTAIICEECGTIMQKRACEYCGKVFWKCDQCSDDYCDDCVETFNDLGEWPDAMAAK